MAVRKPFSRALYQAYDASAKDALTTLLINRGHTIDKTDEDFYVDIVSTKNGNTYYNEAEVKVAWDGPWPTHWAEIRIPERKTRLLDRYSTGFLNFYIFRKDFKQCFRIKDVSLQRDRLREARGRNIMQGELFYHVPYSEAEVINL